MCICLVNMRPPLYTLFPYTTLFRSTAVSEPLHGASIHSALPPLHAEGLSQLQSRTPASSGFPFRDRKSTRLNSSHVAISYAVFCLKKKKLSTIHIHALYFTYYK